MNSLGFKIKYLLKDKLIFFPFLVAITIFTYVEIDTVGDNVFLFSTLFLIAYVLNIINVLKTDKYSEKEVVLVDFKTIDGKSYECYFLDEQIATISKYVYKVTAPIDLKKDHYYRVVISDKGKVIAVLGVTNKSMSDSLDHMKNVVMEDFQKGEIEIEQRKKILEQQHTKQLTLSDILLLIPDALCFGVCVCLLFLFIIKGDLFKKENIELVVIAVLYIYIRVRGYIKNKRG